MKKGYVRPMMKSEVFVTNAYCGACQDNPMPDTSTIVINPEGPWNNPRYNDSISQASLKTKGYILGHTFLANERADMISEANGYEGTAQWYWPCDCHDGAYYLEYSVEWAEKWGSDHAVLFKETNNKPGLQVNWMCNNWPDTKNGNADRAIALTKMANGTIINNS